VCVCVCGVYVCVWMRENEQALSVIIIRFAAYLHACVFMCCMCAYPYVCALLLGCIVAYVGMCLCACVRVCVEHTCNLA